MHNRLTDINLSGDVDELTETARFIFRIIAKYGEGAVYFSFNENDDINVHHLAVALRMTFKYRYRPVGWNEALDILRKECKLQDIDEEDLLFGLI